MGSELCACTHSASPKLKPAVLSETVAVTTSVVFSFSLLWMGRTWFHVRKESAGHSHRVCTNASLLSSSSGPTASSKKSLQRHASGGVRSGVAHVRAHPPPPACAHTLACLLACAPPPGEPPHTRTHLAVAPQCTPSHSTPVHPIPQHPSVPHPKAPQCTLAAHMHAPGGLKVRVKDGHVLEAKGQDLLQALHHRARLVALAVGAAQHLGLTQSFGLIQAVGGGGVRGTWG